MGNITMSDKEREQLKVFEKLKVDEITKTEAAARLGISVRWVRTKFKRYLEQGDAGLIHLNRHKQSKKQWCTEYKDLAISLLKSEWQGFGPTFVSQKLAEIYGIKVSDETVRNMMIKERFWRGRKGNSQHRKRRERRRMIGIMIQLDGSPHDWFEGRGSRCTLLVFIDDATSKLLWLEFVSSESHEAVMGAFQHYIEKHGRPHEIYVDYGSVFSVNTNNPERDKKTQFERAMQELDIKVIHARSPQAKGRVERANKTLQDRLVKEMRLAVISSIQEANKFIHEGGYIEKHNTLFALPPTQEGNGHRPVNIHELDNIFCLKEERKVNNDHTISYKKQILQLSKNQPTTIRPKTIIIVHEHLDGAVSLHLRNCKLNFERVATKIATNLSPTQWVEAERTRDALMNYC